VNFVVVRYPGSETVGSEKFQSPMQSNVFATWRNVIGYVAAVNSAQLIRMEQELL
jgi:hypothetical protein